MGLLDPNQMLNPQTQGLLGLGQGLLQSSGWSPTPISTGQAMGQGLQSGLGAYTQAQGRLDKKNAKGKIEVKTIPWGVDADGKPQKRAVALQNGNVVGFPGATTPTTPGVNVNLPPDGPSLETGMAWIDPSNPALGTTPIPGGKVDRANIAQAKKKASMVRLAKEQGQRVLGHISRARSQAATGWATGVEGTVLSKWPGSTAHDLQATIKSIKANTTFDKLLEVKRGGGTLGAINTAELEMLGAAVSNLEQSQSIEQFNYNLNIVEELYKKIVAQDEGAPTPAQGSTDQQGMSRLEYLRAKQRGEAQ